MECFEDIGGAFRPERAFAMSIRGPVFFLYVGRTSLTVIGSATGRQYGFDRPGRRLPVDPRDAGGMTRIRVLRHTEADGGMAGAAP